MNKSLLIVVIFLGVFSILKVIMFIAYSFVIKPKVDENGKVIEQGKTEKTEETQQKEDDDTMISHKISFLVILIFLIFLKKSF